MPDTSLEIWESSVSSWLRDVVAQFEDFVETNRADVSATTRGQIEVVATNLIADLDAFLREYVVQLSAEQMFANGVLRSAEDALLPFVGRRDTFDSTREVIAKSVEEFDAFLVQVDEEHPRGMHG